jgi:hypothetical protein
MRDENERRIEEWIASSQDEDEIKKKKLQTIKEFDEKARKARIDRNSKINAKKMEEIKILKEEKKYLLKEILTFENTQMQKNREKHMEVKRQTEEARKKREMEQAQKEQKIRENY